MWKEIRDFDNYLINEDGEVKNKKKDKLLKPRRKNKGQGYYEVVLYKNGKPHYKSIHRLVAENFIDNPHNYPIVNHIDGNKINNHVSNLEWCTVSYNTYHGVHMLHQDYWTKGVEKAVEGNKKKTIILDINTGEILEFNSRKECAKYYGAEFKNIVGKKQLKRFSHLRLVGDANATDKLENQ